MTPRQRNLCLRMRQLMVEVQLKSVEDWMRGLGFPPETSHLILPSDYQKGRTIWPRYVSFSNSIEWPVLRTGQRPEGAADELV